MYWNLTRDLAATVQKDLLEPRAPGDGDKRAIGGALVQAHDGSVGHADLIVGPVLRARVRRVRPKDHGPGCAYATRKGPTKTNSQLLA